MLKYALFTQSEYYSLEFTKNITRPEILVSRSNNINAKVFLKYDDAYSGNYSTENLKPIDNTILKELAVTEAIVMRMMDRTTLRENFYHRQAIYRNHLKYWSSVLDNIDIIVFHVIPHEVFDFIAYSYAKLKKIKIYFYYSLPSLPSHYLMYIAEDINNQSKRVNDQFNEFIKFNDLSQYKFEENNNFLQIYDGLINDPIEKRISYTGVEKNKRKNNRKRNFNAIKKIIKSTLYSFSQIFGEDHSYGIFSNGYIKSKNFSFDSIHGDFLYFPLHYQPEASSNPIGEFYEDQLLIIELLLDKIKLNKLKLKLFIKEHPRQLKGSRKKEFYEYFNKNKFNDNLIVVDQNISSHLLLSKSSGVITISGTIALEALFAGKPVLMFGSRIFDGAPGIVRAKTDTDIDFYFSNIEKIKVGVLNPNWNTYKKILQEYLIEGTNSRYYFDNGNANEKNSAINAIKGLILYLNKFNKSQFF